MATVLREFSVFDMVRFVKASWDEVSVAVLRAAWRPLVPSLACAAVEEPSTSKR